MSPEKKKSDKIPQLHFKPESYTSSDEPEFLDQFLEFLKARHFDPEQLVFSGFDGQPIAKGEPLPRYNGVYAMNITGWRNALRSHGGESNPAEYAERYIRLGGLPCIGLLDKNQLREIYSHRAPEHPENQAPGTADWRTIKMEDLAIQVPDDVVSEDVNPAHTPPPYDEYIEEREEFIDIVPGENLVDLPHDRPIEKGVMHINPEGSPIDALVGVVFLEFPE